MVGQFLNRQQDHFSNLTAAKYCTFLKSNTICLQVLISVLSKDISLIHKAYAILEGSVVR